MSDTLIVILDGSVAGTVTRGARGRLRFDYDEDYRNQPDATPLSVEILSRPVDGAAATSVLWTLAITSSSSCWRAA